MIKTLVLGGPPKSATTSVFLALEHSGLYRSPRLKEPQYWAYGPEAHPGGGMSPARPRLTPATIDDYDALYDRDGRGDSIWRIDGSTHCFLHARTVVDAVRRSNRDVRFLFILRDPVTRAYSAFMHLQRDRGGLGKTFLEALDENSRESRTDRDPLRAVYWSSIYSPSVEIFASRYGPRVTYIDFTDLNGPEQGMVLRAALDRLEAPSPPSITLSRANPGGTPRSRLAWRFTTGAPQLRAHVRGWMPSSAMSQYRRLRRSLLKPTVSLAPETYRQAAAFFDTDLRRLQDLLPAIGGAWGSRPS